MRPFYVVLIALAAAFLFSASSCDWEGDDEPVAATISAPTVTGEPNLSIASAFFNDLDIGGKYGGNLPGGFLTDNALGIDKKSLNIGADGNSVTVEDDQGNGYAGDIGFFMSEINGDTDPFKQGTLLASRQISFSGFDSTAERNVEFTGMIKLISDGIIDVEDGGTIGTILTLEGTWVQIGEDSSAVDADKSGPDLDLSDFLSAD